MITLFSLQLCLIAYEQHSQFNPLLITYLYILLTNCSITLLSILMIMLDATMYLSTGIVGTAILFLTPLSWLTLKIKDDMYNKIIIPCIFIMLYTIFYNIILYHWLYKSIQISQIITSTLQNCLTFIFIWTITKQSIHD